MIFTPKSSKSAKNKAFHGHERTRGNAMIYVLLALALFGVLTATLSGQSNDADSQNINDEQVVFYTNELIEYAAAAKTVVDQMIMTGTSIDDLDFVNPSSAAFDTPPHINKVYHPEGGGLNYLDSPSENTMNILSSAPGWKIQTQTNVEWTATSATDILLTANQIKEAVCRQINLKILGTSDIPELNGVTPTALFFENSTNNDLTVTGCPECEGYPSYCVTNSTIYSFYTVIAAR